MTARLAVVLLDPLPIPFVIVPNFVHIGQGVAEIWPFSIFQDGGRPPSWIFKKLEILTGSNSLFAYVLQPSENVLTF